MALQRYTQLVDGSIPVQALLYTDEELYASQDGVGIYDGLQKSPEHQAGTINLTSHRLFYIDSHHPASASFELNLSTISQTEYYAGLFKSSAKVTCHLSGDFVRSTPPFSLQSSSSSDIFDGDSEIQIQGRGTPAGFESWECQVCGYRNAPGLSPAAAKICGLCGVPRTAVPPPSAPPPVPITVSSIANRIHDPHLSTSLPSSGLSSTTHLSVSGSGSGSSPQDGHRQPIACPACTFLNHPSMQSCEICSTDLPKPKPWPKSAPASRPITPNDTDSLTSSTSTATTNLIKLSFRKGGDKSFYAVLKRTLKSKAWETTGHGSSLGQDGNRTDVNNRNDLGSLGISGIFKKVETTAQDRESDMKDALQDLEAFMVKAKDMVRLAADLNERLTAASASTASASPSPSASAPALPEEATFIRSSMSQLGLQMANTPVTLDMMKDERKWFEELARELVGVLQGSPDNAIRNRNDERTIGGMMKDRGIIALDEVWGGWNRARGVALIPPSTFLQVIPLIPIYSNPTIQHRAFTSGLNVLHTPPYSHAAFSARLCSSLMMGGPKTSIEVAEEEGLTIGLTEEMVEAVEVDGGICRDDGGDTMIDGGGGAGTGVEVRWWVNVFVGYVWDGQG